MHLRPPHVPPAAQLAQAGTQGPRVLPGVYTVHMEKNGKVYETKLEVNLDPRVNWTEADRKAQYAAAMKVYALFNDESALFERIAGLRQEVADVSGHGSPSAPLLARLKAFDAKLDAIRKEIVATTEGGAITGEERLREHTDQLYGAITSWDGAPSAYQLENIAALAAQLGDISREFEQLTTTDLPSLNQVLHESGTRPLAVPPLTASDDEDDGAAGGGPLASGGRADPDSAQVVNLPRNLRLWN
jgi:hypothetical protein